MARLLRPVMKIMSVMPAAAASSTAYWMSGLSTTGSISFGLALVTGRKRLPRPATGNTALVNRCAMLSVALQKFAQTALVQHGDAQRFRALKLAAGLGARDDVIGVLRHRRRDLVPLGLYQRFRLIARNARQRAGQDESQRGRVARGHARLRTDAHALARVYQALDHLAIVLGAEELPQAVHDLGADAFQGHRRRRFATPLALGVVLAHRLLLRRQRVPVRVEQPIEAAEVAREDLGDLLADAGDAEREDKARQRGVARALDAVDDIARRLLAHALQ